MPCTATRREPASANARVTPRSSIAGTSAGDGSIVWASGRSSNSCPSGLPSGTGGSDVLAPNGHARRTSDAHAACGRHRPSVASSLLPSGLSPSAPCEGIHRRIHDGSWAGDAPWGAPPTTGRGFHPTPKARLVFVLCVDDTPCRILARMTLCARSTRTDGPVPSTLCTSRASGASCATHDAKLPVRRRLPRPCGPAHSGVQRADGRRLPGSARSPAGGIGRGFVRRDRLRDAYLVGASPWVRDDTAGGLGRAGPGGLVDGAAPFRPGGCAPGRG